MAIALAILLPRLPSHSSTSLQLSIFDSHQPIEDEDDAHGVALLSATPLHKSCEEGDTCILENNLIS